MKTRKVILAMYFVLGLPGLPYAFLYWLAWKYIFQSKTPMGKELFGSLMITTTLIGGLLFWAIKCSNH
jgi:hypothetical protein